MCNNVYIMSLEAADIYSHMFRNQYLKKDYVGMLPYSLELIKLEEIELKTWESKRFNKTLSNDIINVKFKQKVRSGKEIVKSTDKKILETSNEEYGEKLIAYRDLISKEKLTWKEIKPNALRKKLYTEGFTIEFDNGTKIEYVVYSRTSAKSRTGQVLFIKKQLRDKMIKWKRLGMNLDGRADIDYPGLLSYESLVSSSIEGLIEINSDNILIVDDVKSTFPINANVVEKNGEGMLVSNPKDNYIMENELYDGESLLDSSYFNKVNRSDKGMMLLRQHMYKTCAFNTNIQQFLQDYCPEGIEFDKWELINMFGQPIFARDIHMITTPSSLKALKFSNVKGSKRRTWKHWKKKVNADGNLFGICKSDMQSKRGTDEEGNIVNQTSYQMLNAMPIDIEDMRELSVFEVNYIEQLKNNDDVYAKYLLETANKMNCNEMLVDLYYRNSKIANTKPFKDKRKKDINNYVTHVKRGKIRLNGDYCTIAGNVIKYLFHAIGRKPTCKVLEGNEVYTTLHKFNEEYVAFRNPMTSPSNVLIVKNVHNQFIEKYFNFSDNIICVNAICFPIQRVLSGMDYDSDALVLFNNNILLSNAKKCYGHYRVCVNGVIPDPTQYTVCAKDMAKIDTTLADSQEFIGRVVNLGQHYMSAYWDMINNSTKDIEKLDKALEAVDICTVLSEISIDSAKRMYDLNIGKQIAYLSKNDIVNSMKPMFFKYISKNKNIAKNIKKYDTAMDYLYEILDSVEDASDRRTIKLEKLLINRDIRKVKNRQINGIVKAITDMTNEIKNIEATKQCTTDEEKTEKYIAIDNVKNEYVPKIKRYKIKIETVYAIVYKIFKNEVDCKYKIDVLNALYQVDRDVFLQAFKAQK
ncbi:hypothetical protein [Proteiniborus sp. MB09-C3]|uniref:hypothetical protein n=1 Tax=Proteiniborus sp. MB09-C3 TaxID=3050072 RepID=UPI002554D35D|nr:hypothetical protein [Proteiniborus sp. MB09-C3]WIV10527.1 hypothetical protein QO263_10180 [Proteiniborus sp. MB09-C3]